MAEIGSSSSEEITSLLQGINYFEPTAIDSQKYRHVLESEKDLFKNFEIDLIGALKKLSEEIEETESQNGVSQINFSLAGFVVEGSANVYGKKVDFLHSLTNQMVDKMATNYKELNNGDLDEMQPNSSKNLEFKEIKLVDLSSETTDQLNVPNSPRKQLQISSIPDCLKNMETWQKEGDNMQSKSGDDIGHRKDFCINRFTWDCVNIVLTHEISETTSSCNGTVPKNCFTFSDSDEDDDTGADPDQFMMSDNVDDAFTNLGDRHLERVNLLQNENDDQRVAGIAYVEEPVIKTKQLRVPMKCKILSLLDPHQIKVKDEKRPGLRKRVCGMNSYTNTCETSPRLPKKRKSTDVAFQAEPKVKIEPFCNFFERTAHPENYCKTFLKNLPYYPLKPFAYQEFKRRGELNKLKKQNCQISLAETIVNGDSNCSTIYNNHENEENLENGYDTDPDDDIPIDNGLSVDEDSDNQGDDYINSSYKTMERNLENMKSQTKKFKKSTDLSKRVDSWNFHINNILNEEHEHSKFDAIKYQAHILNCFDHVGQTIKFTKAVRGKPLYDVGRYLVCSLFLVSTFCYLRAKVL